MKKLLGIMVLGLLWCSSANAERADNISGNLNDQLKNGFEIIEILQTSGGGDVNFILKNTSNMIIICSVHNPSNTQLKGKRTNCMKP